jgi:hypothetical protein
MDGGKPPAERPRLQAKGRGIDSVIDPNKAFKRKPPKGKGGVGMIVYGSLKGVVDGKGLPTARKGHRQKNASRSAYATAAEGTKHPDNDPLGRELRKERLRQAREEFDGL